MLNRLAIKNKHGFTLLEVIVALGIVTMGILGVFSLVIQTTQVQVTNKNHLIASMLAQEGMELVRHLRDENYLISVNTWNEDISDWDDTFVIDYRGRAFIDDTPDSITDVATKVYFDSALGFYTHVAAGNTATPFSRIITILNDSTSSTTVNCQVAWTDQGRPKKYIVETELHNWR